MIKKTYQKIDIDYFGNNAPIYSENLSYGQIAIQEFDGTFFVVKWIPAGEAGELYKLAESDNLIIAKEYCKKVVQNDSN